MRSTVLLAVIPLLYRSPIDGGLSGAEGEEAFYNPMSMSQSFTEPVPLGCDFTTASQLSLSPLGETGRLQEAGVEYFISPTWTARQARVGSITSPRTAGFRFR